MLLNKKVSIGYIINPIKIDMIRVLVISVSVHYAYAHFKDILPTMPLAVPAFLGTAISILLSFKMSQSYDRWWEARKIWGAIVNDSRAFVIELKSFINDNNIIKTIAYRQIAWNYALGKSLRNQNATEGVEHLLSKEDLEYVKQYKNVPLGILNQNAMTIKTLKENKAIDTFTQIQFDNMFVRFSEHMGKAERIKNTIFPTTYRLFLHTAIYLFLIVLSLSLDNIDLIFELPLLLIIAAVFFSIEKSASHLQDPFMNRPSDTSVTAIAQTIEINIRQLLEEKELPQFENPNSFYVL